jgi:hypothetical protein
MTKQLKIIYHGCVLCGFCYCVYLCPATHQHSSLATKRALADMVLPIPLNNVQKDSAWNIWCGTMV